MKPSFFDEYNITYLTDSGEGKVVDYCTENDIRFQTINHDNIIDSLSLIKQLEPELLICLGWDRKVPESVLNSYMKCINCHGGLLPDYRGNRAYVSIFANIEDEYGPTIHYMTNKFDDGNIILQCPIKGFIEETPLIIHRRLSELTSFILPEAIRLVEEGYEGIKQTGIARYFTGLDRESMDLLRNENIERIRHNMPKQIAPHKKWEMD